MDTSTALEIFSDEELQQIFNRSGCLGRFNSWLSRVRNNRNFCCEKCERQEILDREFLRYNGVPYDGVPYEDDDGKEEEIQKILCINRGARGRTVWAGDCLDGLEMKLSEIRSEPEPNSKEIHPEPEEVQEHKPKTISTKPEAPSEPKDIMEIEPDFSERLKDVC